MNQIAGSTYCVKKGLQQVLRDFVITLSLSNLWFFNVWRFFLINHPISYPYYHWKANPAPILLATILDVLLLSVILWVAITLARGSRKPFMLRIARLTFLIMFFITMADLLLVAMVTTQFRPVIDALIERPQLLFASSRSQIVFLWLWVLGLAAAFALITILLHRLVFRRRQLIKLTTALLLIFSPFVLVTFSQAASQWMTFRSGERFLDNNAPASTQESQSGRRVLWIIFDEMDFRLSFLDRPPSVQLPAFDRLRNEAVFAQNAYPPGGDTVLSLPSLITGRLISWSHRTAPNELMLTFADNNQTVPWSTQPNVFSRARTMGFNTALAGWYHPYCRIIGNSLTRCSWEAPSIIFLPDKAAANLVSHSREVAVTTSMFRIGAVALVPESVRILMASKEGTVWRKYHLENYLNIHREAMALVGDPDLQLILVHYGIPHPPGIYDRSRHDFSSDSSSGYLGNLELANRVLEELRQEMEKTGLWDLTTVLISSDHRLRADRVWKQHLIWQPSFTKVDPSVFNSIRDERVPFILKLAGERTGVNYELPFNTVLSHDLVLAILSGAVSKEADVAKWLDQHRSIGESPYVEGEK